jgi:hypothetical protein
MLVGESADLDLMLDYVLGKSVPPDALDRCSVSDGTGCDIVDAARLAAAISSPTSTVTVGADCSLARLPVVGGP